MKAMKVRFVFACVLVVVLALASSLLAADVRGKITNVSTSASGAVLGSILIEGKKEKDTSVDKAMTRITDKTAIFRMQNGKRVEAKFSDLKAGQTVEATFSGPVAESYPVQATAKEILILEIIVTP